MKKYICLQCGKPTTLIKDSEIPFTTCCESSDFLNLRKSEDFLRYYTTNRKEENENKLSRTAIPLIN